MGRGRRPPSGPSSVSWRRGPRTRRALSRAAVPLHQHRLGHPRERQRDVLRAILEVVAEEGYPRENARVSDPADTGVNSLPDHDPRPLHHVTAHAELERLIPKEVSAAADDVRTAGVLLKKAAHGAATGAEHVRVAGEAARVVDEAARRVDAAVELLTDELSALPEQLVWDRLVVALHAPTNAGKSTLVSALLESDGANIGDGSKDWTTELHRWTWRGVELVDAPGIEGREGALMEDLERALASAHVVAVLITSKEPERGPLVKLAHRARRASEFVSILNLRGRGSTWRRRLANGTIRDSNTDGLEERIRLRMAEAFPGRHVRHLSLNAQLAFVCSSSDIQPRFQRDREKAERIFGTLSRGRAFSGIEVFERLLMDFESEAQARIGWSNTRRAVSSLGDVIVALDAAVEQLQRAADIWRRTVDSARIDVDQALEVHLLRAQHKVRQKGAILSRDIRTKAKGVLERRGDKRAMKRAIKIAVGAAQQDLQKTLEEASDLAHAEVRARLTAFREQLAFEASLDPAAFEGLEDALDAATIGLGEVVQDLMRRAANVVLSFIGGQFAALLTGVVEVASSIRRWLFREPRTRRRDAQRQLGQTVDRAVRQMVAEQQGALRRSFASLQDRVQEAFATSLEQAAALGRATGSVDDIVAKLQARATVLASACLGDATGPRGLVVPVFGEHGELDALVYLGNKCRALSLPLPHAIMLGEISELSRGQDLDARGQRQVRRAAQVFGE